MANELKQSIKAKGTNVSSHVKNYGNEAFFVKKGKESKAFLEEHGFPKELVIKNK